MLGNIAYCLGLFTAGFIQDALVASWHRSANTYRIKSTATLSFVLTCLGLIIITDIIKKLLDPSFGSITYLFIVVYALGKSAGAYISLKYWHKYENKLRISKKI